MAITYHAGRRIQGLERTGNTADVEEDFSTDNSYDTQTGTAYTVDYTTDDRIEFDFTKDGSTHEVSFDLESMGGFTMDSSSWVAEWTFKVLDSFVQASASGAHATMGISSVADGGNYQTGDHVAVEIRNVVGAGSLMNLTGGVNSGMDNVRTTGSVDVGTNGFERFIRLTKNGNTCTLQIYTDSNRSTTPTTHTITLAHTVAMKYFRVLNFTGANGGSNAAGNLSVDDFKFYNGITSAPVAPAGDVKPTDVQEGSRWEETDTRKMYHYTYDWFLEGTTIPPQPSTRGLFAGGEVSSNVIDYITIATAGNATDFGDLTLDGWNSSAVSSGTRAVFMGGTSSSGFSNVIQYVTVATTGNATDFGDLITAMNSSAGVSSETRGIMGGGNNGSNVSNMEFITIATAGTGTDFGDLSQARHSPAGVSSGTRGVWGGGYAGGNVNTIDYVTIDANPTVTASTFGNLSQARRQLAGCGSTTRGLFGGGYASGHVNTIDYITIDSTPTVTATDFGNLTRSNNVLGACSSNTRGVWGGGNNTNVNTIDYVTIDSIPTVTATDFGDLTAGRAGVVGTDGY